MNRKLFSALAALIAGIVLAGCTFSLEPVNALDTDGFINGNTGLIKVVNHPDSGFSLSAVRIIQPDGSFNEYLFDDLGLTPGNSKDYRFTAGAIYLVKFHNGLGWTTDAKSATVVKGETVEVTFNGEPTTPDDLSVDKGDLTVFNEIPNGEYVIEEIRVSCGEAGRETAVYQYETEIKFDEHPTFKVPAGKYFVRARIRKNGGTVVSKWSVPALAGQADGSVSLNAEPGEITVSVDTAGIAVFNRKVLLEDGSVNTPLEEVINLLVVQGEGRITLNWTDPEDADVDHIEISYISTSMPPGSAPLTQTVGKYKETAVISGLEKGEAYAITVRTVDAGGNNKSEGVKMVVVMGKDTPPAEVTALAVTTGDRKVHLTWTNPTDEDFDHIEISYSADSGLITILEPVVKPAQEKMISPLNYGTIYAFVVRTVDTSGNKSQGSLVIASMAKVVDDLDLAQYITAPVAGAVPDTRRIKGTQYTGTVVWFQTLPTPGAFTGKFIKNSAYEAVITLTPNPGYTFAGLGTGNGFTFSGADRVVTDPNGYITVHFLALGPVWYVANYGDDTTGTGVDAEHALLTLSGDNGAAKKGALKRIAEDHAAAKASGPLAPNGLPSATIVVIGTSGDTEMININDGNSADTYPPITLRGMGPTEAGVLTANKTTSPAWTGEHRVLNIINGAEVTLGNDLTITGGGKSGTVAYGAGVYVGISSAFTMNGGTITDNTVSTEGGGVFVRNSTFTMNGGTISNNSAGLRTGGVSINNTSFFYMNGGAITNNTCFSSGGGVRVLLGSEFTMTGGTIAGNSSTDNTGGGVFIQDAGFTMSGGSIINNTAFQSAGGVDLDAGTTGTAFTMTGGTIADNTARQFGGGVFLSPDGSAVSFTMQGGTIAGNTAGTGGGVAVRNGVFRKEPAVTGGSSGIIYGNDGGANSNTATLGETSLDDWGHAVYIADGPKTRETTVLPGQRLDSTITGSDGGWVD